MDLTATQLRYIRQKQKGKKMSFPNEKKKKVERKRISPKTEQDKKIKRPTDIGRKAAGFLLTEDVVKSGSQPTERNGA